MANLEVRAAIGEVVIQTTWMEYVIVKLVQIANNFRTTETEMRSLLLSRRELLSAADRAVGRLEDMSAAENIKAWLRVAKDLVKERDEIVHSILLYSEPVNWTAFHPKGLRWITRQPEELEDLASRIRSHADEGNYLSLYDWRHAFDNQPTD